MQAETASFPSPGNAASDRRRPNPDRRVLHRAKALKEAAVDTRPCDRDKAVAEKSISRGHAPSTLDLGPELAASNDRWDGNEPDPTSHLPQNQQPTPHLGNKSRRPIAPRKQRAPADEQLNKDSTKGDLPPQARRRRRSEAPTGRGRVREDLFCHGATATASTTLPGTKTLTLVPNLQRRTERRRSPTHPRAQRPPEAEGSGDLAGENSNRFPLACLNCWEEGVRERSRLVGFKHGIQMQEFDASVMQALHVRQESGSFR